MKSVITILNYKQYCRDHLEIILPILMKNSIILTSDMNKQCFNPKRCNNLQNFSSILDASIDVTFEPKTFYVSPYDRDIYRCYIHVNSFKPFEQEFARHTFYVCRLEPVRFLYKLQELSKYTTFITLIGDEINHIFSLSLEYLNETPNLSISATILRIVSKYHKKRSWEDLIYNKYGYVIIEENIHWELYFMYQDIFNELLISKRVIPTTSFYWCDMHINKLLNSTIPIIISDLPKGFGYGVRNMNRSLKESIWYHQIEDSLSRNDGFQKITIKLNSWMDNRDLYITNNTTSLFRYLRIIPKSPVVVLIGRNLTNQVVEINNYQPIVEDPDSEFPKHIRLLVLCSPIVHFLKTSYYYFPDLELSADDVIQAFQTTSHQTNREESS